MPYCFINVALTFLTGETLLSELASIATSWETMRFCEQLAVYGSTQKRLEQLVEKTLDMSVPNATPIYDASAHHSDLRNAWVRFTGCLRVAERWNISRIVDGSLDSEAMDEVATLQKDDIARALDVLQSVRTLTHQ